MIDGQLTPQKEAPSIPFDIFNAVFNVGYFMKLEDKEQRLLLIQNTPKIDKIALFKKMGGKISVLDKDTLDDVPESIKILGAKKLHLSKTKATYTAILDYLKVFPLVATKKTAATKKIQEIIDSEITRITKLLDTNNHILTELEDNYKILTNLPIEEMKIKLSDLDARLKTEFKNVEIVLKELYKSEIGYKEIFKFKINGIEYKNLSAGEKIRFDIIVSKFFNSLLADPIDCYFLDDTSLLDEDVDAPKQAFITNIWPHEIELISK
jgi:hypothetical protein